MSWIGSEAGDAWARALDAIAGAEVDESAEPLTWLDLVSPVALALAVGSLVGWLLTQP